MHAMSVHLYRRKWGSYQITEELYRHCCWKTRGSLIAWTSSTYWGTSAVQRKAQKSWLSSVPIATGWWSLTCLMDATDFTLRQYCFTRRLHSRHFMPRSEYIQCVLIYVSTFKRTRTEHVWRGKVFLISTVLVNIWALNLPLLFCTVECKASCLGVARLTASGQWRFATTTLQSTVEAHVTALNDLVVIEQTCSKEWQLVRCSDLGVYFNSPTVTALWLTKTPVVKMSR